MPFASGIDCGGAGAIEIGTASKLPKPWHNLVGDGLLFDLRLAKDKLVNRLPKRFEDAILKSAGVVHVDSDGRVALAPTLAQNCSCILAVRSRRTEKVVDLRRSGPCISSEKARIRIEQLGFSKS